MKRLKISSELSHCSTERTKIFSKSETLNAQFSFIWIYLKQVSHRPLISYFMHLHVYCNLDGKKCNHRKSRLKLRRFPLMCCRYKTSCLFSNDKNEIKVNYFWPINLIYGVHSCLCL